jgi:type VI protein secretion system component Hcp
MVDQSTCDGYLRLIHKDLGQIAGECLDEVYAGQIELIDFEFGSSSEFDEESTREAAMKKLEEDYGESPEVGIRYLFGDSNFEEDMLERGAADVSEQSGCEFSCTKFLDRSSPALFQAYGSALVAEPGSPPEFTSAWIQLRKATGEDRGLYFTVFFKDVRLVSYELEVNPGETPTESLTFSFGACRMEYRPQASDGDLQTAIRAGWNFLAKPPAIF